MNINQVVIAGRLTRDPELKSTPSGMSVASFSIATNKLWKDKNTGEKKEATEFVNCVAWGKTAETVCQYFQKGKEIYVEGRLQTRSWDSQDGKKNYKTEVVIETFQFVGSNNSGNAGGASAQPRPTNINQGTAPSDEYIDAAPNDDIKVEDIPF